MTKIKNIPAGQELSSVLLNGWDIQHLHDDQKTPEVCLAAVGQDGFAIQFLNESQRTPEVCLAAVTQDRLAAQILTFPQRRQVQMMQEAGSEEESDPIPRFVQR